jgi:O-antigen ligase
VGLLNGYLQSRHLNPHNQLFYIVLHYGIPGLLVWFFFWFQAFQSSANSLPLVCIWLFAFCSSQTEIYLDREFGTQVYLLVMVITVWLENSSVKKPAGLHAV